MGYSAVAVALRRSWIVASVGCGAAIAEPAYDHHVKLTPENSAIGNFPAQKFMYGAQRDQPESARYALRCQRPCSSVCQ